MRRIGIMPALILTLVLAAAPAVAEELQPPEVEYQGDMTTNADGQTVNARIFYGVDRFRMNMQSPQGPVAMVFNMTERTGFMLMESQRMAMRLPMERAQANFSTPPQNAEFEAMGTETVNGVETTKYRVTRKDPSKDGFEGFAWVTDQRIVVRMDGTHYGPQGASDVDMNLTNLQVGDIDDGLFVVPEGYRVMNMGQQ